MTYQLQDHYDRHTNRNKDHRIWYPMPLLWKPLIADVSIGNIDGLGPGLTVVTGNGKIQTHVLAQIRSMANASLIQCLTVVVINVGLNSIEITSRSG